jgi:UDP-glucose 4-epimerase
VPAVSVRLSGVFGPLDRTTGARAVDCLPKRLVHAAREARKLRLSGLTGGGDFIHAGDIAAGMLALLGCAELRHPVYNIAHGRFTTLAALARMVPGLDWEEAGPGEADIAADPALTAGRWGAYDISRIVAETGWHPRPLEAAIADYAGWLKAHRW